MNIDCDNKRFIFIRKISSLNQEFFFCSGDVRMKIYNIYAMSLYGSCLRDLFSEKCDRLYKAWNVGIRISYNVSRYTHKYLIESISNTLHPKVVLSSRYVGFFQTLKEKCTKPVVRIMSKMNAYDLRTTYGRNLNYIGRACNTEINELSPNIVKTKMKYREIDDENAWRPNVINDLMLAREGELTIPNFSTEEVQDMLNFVCSS